MAESDRYFARLEGRVRAGEAAAAAALRANPECNTPECVAVRAKSASMGYLGHLMGPAAYNIYYNATGSTFQILFYLSLVVLIIFLMLTFVHFTMFPIFSFSADQPGIISVPTASDKQITYTKGPATYDLSGAFTNVPPCTYTLGADVGLSGNFMLAQIPRVILYRAGAPVQTQNTLSGITDSTTDEERLQIMNNFLIREYPDTNILIWLDPIKNDLYVSVVVTNPSGGSGISGRMLQTSSPVENVPIKKVFRLAVVFTNAFVEIYINGRLEKSMVLDSPPVTIASTSAIYPTVKSIQQNVMIANLSLWPRVLTARDINSKEAAPIKDNKTFFGT
jgi:hypothetical protein